MKTGPTNTTIIWPHGLGKQLLLAIGVGAGIGTAVAVVSHLLTAGAIQ
jgi:hypothetical protein